MHEGDISYSHVKAGVLVLKILRVSTDQNTYHCLVFKPISTPPKLADIPKLDILAWHSPISAESINEKNTLIGNIAVTPNELVGYFEYLKRTDFDLYIEETHLISLQKG